MVLILRSLLFVPGSNYRAIMKTPTINCDAVIFDLEDAVSMEDKETARIFVKDAIEKLNFPDGKMKVVRVNSWDTGLCEQDLDWVVRGGLDAIMLPKSESKDDVSKLDEYLTKLEEDRGLEKKSIKVIPLIESHVGVLKAYEIASSSDRCIALAFGALDYYRTLGRTYFKFSEEQYELLFARSMIINAAKAAGLKAIDTPFFGMLVDKKGLEREARLVWQLGFDGKLVIHPNHVDVVNAVFTPSEEDVKQAEEVVEVYEKAKTMGMGAATLRGKMIDYATYVQAKELLEVYEALIRKEKV